MEVCLNANIYFSIIHITLWPFLLMNSRPIFTPSCPTLALASNIYTVLTSSPSPQVPFFKSRTAITYVTTHHTRTLHFFTIWYLNAVITYQSQPVSTAIPSSNSFRDITTIGTHQHLGRILKDIFFFFFVLQDSMALR